MDRRKFIIKAAAAGSALYISPILSAKSGEDKIPIILDSDTANEIDDLYAIVRGIYEPKISFLGLSSGQWEHQLSPKNTATESQRLNEDILRLTNRQDIPSPPGSDLKIGKPWGGTKPRDTPASRLMIETAMEMPEGKKLLILSIGAPTNVASAILLAPEIVPKIRCYCMGGKFYPGRKVWDKDEFNFRRDLNAVNVLFNTKGLDLFILPATTLYDYKYSQEEVFGRLKGKGGIWDYLVNRWKHHSPDAKQWIMWDLALVQAIIHPEFATLGTYKTPPENNQRNVHVYTKIDEEAMFKDWWDMVGKYSSLN